MKIDDITTLDFKPAQVDLINTFDVIQNNTKSGIISLFNLNEGVQIDLSDSLNQLNYKIHITKAGDNLKYISYKYYGYVNYWWIIAKINGIDDVFEDLTAGKKLYIFDIELLNYIYNEIVKERNSNG